MATLKKTETNANDLLEKTCNYLKCITKLQCRSRQVIYFKTIRLPVDSALTSYPLFKLFENTCGYESLFPL